MSLLLKERHEVVQSEGEADLIVLNTCSVKDATQQKILRKASDTRKPLVMTGCLVQADQQLVQKTIPLASLLGTFSEGKIVEAAESAFSGRKFVETETTEIPLLFPHVEGVIARVQISSGCASSCSFCSTKLARGNVKSYRPRQLLDAIGEDISNGAREIQLTSQDTGAYGLDCNTTLPELLERITEINGEYRVRVGMLNPQHFLRMRKELIQVFRNEKIYKFFHIPIQSGSNTVLRHMKRGYSAEQAMKVILEIKEAFPKAFLETDVIVGYPTEKEEDFQKTLEFMRKAGFDVVNVSKYSARPHTPAAKLKQLNNNEIKKRSEEASELAKKIGLEKNKEWVGRKVKALVTEKAKEGFTSRTSEYKPVMLEKAEIGEFAEVEVTEARVRCLVGRKLC